MRDPIQKIGKRLRNTISSPGAPSMVCGSTEDVQMHHVRPVKNIKAKSAIGKYKKAINTPQSTFPYAGNITCRCTKTTGGKIL